MYDNNPAYGIDRIGRPKLSAELRRAGYHDLEPAPRLKNHWANQPGSVKARSRVWRKLRAAR